MGSAAQGLARDGQFVVLGDRTQVPSGAGYALENRAVMSHTMPNFLGQCNVQKLSPFFTSLQHSLRSLAPKNADGARVIVLTPGPYNETFFEHAYLARHLGYGHFQGKDLTVRDSKVYLKTLSGLHRVDVILRRVDDDFCDPLELFHNSYLGVPGLLQAVREGNVAIANALGSGAVQAAGFLPFLPDLCRFLLGEQLLLPSVRTWWCGEESSRKYVLANLSQLVIKQAFPSSGMISVFSAHQTADQLQQLAAKINLRPHLYVGQEVLMEYSTPALTDHGLEGRRFSVRALLTSTSKGYCVMPGALTRITDSMDSRVVSMQKGGGSKDTWIVSDNAIEPATPPSTPATRAHSLSRGGDDLPSGMADDMFWLGRYVQRAQSTVRTARVMFSRIIDQSESSNQIAIGSLSSLLMVTGTNAAGATIELSLAQTLLRPNHPDGLRESLASAIRLARMLRHLLPVDAWRILQSLEREVAAFELRIDQPTASILPLLDAIAVALASFSGFANQSMTRGQAWCFLEIGQHIERAMSTPRLLRCCIPHQGNSQDITPLLDAVLDVTDNLLSYRQRYLTHFELHTVADMLLADETNPRSVAYQLASMDRHLAMLPRDRAHPYRNQDQRILLKVTGLIQLNDMLQGRDMVAQTDTQLDKMLATILEQMAMLSDVIAQMYFAHSAVPQALAGEELQL